MLGRMHFGNGCITLEAVMRLNKKRSKQRHIGIQMLKLNASVHTRTVSGSRGMGASVFSETGAMVGTGVIPGGSVQFGESGAHSMTTPLTGIRQSGCSHSRGVSASSLSRLVYWNLSGKQSTSSKQVRQWFSIDPYCDCSMLQHVSHSVAID